MSNLIPKLKEDHKKLVSLLNDIRSAGLNSENLSKLNSAKAGLLAHLALEDKSLYPPLWEKAKTDRNLQSKLNLLAQDMEEVSKAVLEFFAKYEKGGDPIEFAKDFGKIFQRLSTRIRREEESLYPEFEQRNLDKAA